MVNPFCSLLAMSSLLLLCGCSSLWSDTGHGTRNGVSSSLVDYLYPDGEVPPGLAGSIPQLELPLRVGVAFVPTASGRNDLSEAMKMSLLENVKQEFAAQEYIAHIEVIPDTYLRSANGIRGMQQVARLYSVDVMALVSYDQIAVSEDNNASFLYWTIVGAYLVPGTDNEVQTFVDTAVIDVNTAQLLFRAPGVNRTNKRSTAVQSYKAVRTGSELSFATAVGDMTTNLGKELVRFEEDVKTNPARANVTWQDGRGGTGSLDGYFALLLALIAFSAHRVRRAPHAV